MNIIIKILNTEPVSSIFWNYLQSISLHRKWALAPPMNSDNVISALTILIVDFNWYNRRFKLLPDRSRHKQEGEAFKKVNDCKRSLLMCQTFQIVLAVLEFRNPQIDHFI